ncbi:hypothetical protein AAFF_G00003220 [Aldrovandia affinis]|uniref:Uncharacterized protein n=1 Tax=Aldrovandia affinis TaxID=143900 RepID=A0AAD7TDN8_9TELE|nr:hypothetical protein AAFF_G00003220 [Aldrovandia affinis]
MKRSGLNNPSLSGYLEDSGVVGKRGSRSGEGSGSDLQVPVRRLYLCGLGFEGNTLDVLTGLRPQRDQPCAERDSVQSDRLQKSTEEKGWYGGGLFSSGKI